MIVMTSDQAKGMFFDRKVVTNAVDRAARRVLSRFGAFVRRGARSSIRKRKRVAEPGMPPSSHTGLLKRNIFFLYEPHHSSVVIGPTLLGTWIGGFAFNPVWATLFLAVGIGAILQVVWEVGKLRARSSQQAGEAVVNWRNLGGLGAGLAIMYFTAVLVKF